MNNDSEQPVLHDYGVNWRNMDSAPRDDTMVRLLVDFTEHSTEDAERAPTIGANNFDNDGEDRWKFAGWCWSHDHFVEGEGTPVGWLPMLECNTISTAERGVVLPDVNDLSNLIRSIPKWRSMGAGALAESILSNLNPAPAEQPEPTFCEYCGGNDEHPQDHCMDCTRPVQRPGQVVSEGMLMVSRKRLAGIAWDAELAHRYGIASNSELIVALEKIQEDIDALLASSQPQGGEA